MKKILLIGGGGHCKSVLDTILSLEEYDEVGIIDKEVKTEVLGIPVIGTDAMLPILRKEGWTDALITVGSVGDTSARRSLYRVLSDLGFAFPVIIDKSAVIADDILIGEGTFVGKRAIVNAGARIGECCIINSGAVIEHDCSVGGFSHVSVGAVMCGHVSVGSDSHIGAGSTIRQQITIGSNVLIGTGSVVVKDIPDGTKAFGNPCRVVNG